MKPKVQASRSGPPSGTAEAECRVQPWWIEASPGRMLPVPQSLGVWAVTLSNRANTKRLFKSILQISSDFYSAYSSKLMLVEVGLVARPLGSWLRSLYLPLRSSSRSPWKGRAKSLWLPMAYTKEDPPRGGTGVNGNQKVRKPRANYAKRCLILKMSETRGLHFKVSPEYEYAEKKRRRYLHPRFYSYRRAPNPNLNASQLPRHLSARQQDIYQLKPLTSSTVSPVASCILVARSLHKYSILVQASSWPESWMPKKLLESFTEITWNYETMPLQHWVANARRAHQVVW